MPTNQTFVTNLIRTYHGKALTSTKPFHSPTIEQVRYLCELGLGPIAYRTYGEKLRESDPEVYSVLLSADLTSRVIYKQMEHAAVTLLTCLHTVGVTPTLLKGVSTANEFYSSPHFRLMGDIDILVNHFEVPSTMQILADLGYQTKSQEWQEYKKKGHHHLPGARNQETDVTVEVHTSLIPPKERLAQEPFFQRDNIDNNIVEFDFCGTTAARFTPEFQLVYTISHWGLDGNWAVNVTSINDVIHILGKYDATLNWSMLASWMAGNPRLYPNMAALLRYLERTDIINMTPRMEKALTQADHDLQPATQKILFWLLQKYPMNSRERAYDGYARWRAAATWQELTKPNIRNIRIPVAIARVLLRSIHHGKYNPVRWLLNLYRHFIF